MSKFLTPPVWYDGAGTLNEMLTGTSIEDGNIVIGKGASSDVNVFSSIIIGGGATGGNGSSGQISIGGETSASNTIAIGPSAAASAANSIAIGAGATVTAQNTIQLGDNNAAYTLNVGNGFTITPITSGDYTNQVILGNVNQIKAPSDGISFEVGERRGNGTIIFPTKIKTLMVDSNQYSVGTISKTSTQGSLNLDANCLYVINFGSIRAMLHTTTNNSTTHQFIYSLNSTTDYVMYVNNVLSNTISVTCKLQKYNKSDNTYTDYTDSDFTAIKVCSFT